MEIVALLAITIVLWIGIDTTRKTQKEHDISNGCAWTIIALAAIIVIVLFSVGGAAMQGDPRIWGE